ncbi:MAG: HD domain-containing protein [Candidatus Nealsonbacteria bacterium]|nr:HD domain-containing protein [Candidatus Nealsonbacteria bacterium]
MITLNQLKSNPYLSEFIKRTETRMHNLKYTNHGFDHASLVSDRARTIAMEIGLAEKEQELSAIAGFAHDFANFLSRGYHNYFGALIFYQTFAKDFSPAEMALLMQAIANHDKFDMEFSDPISAVVVLADKSDVRRSRVTIKDMKIIKEDIHNRVNFAVKSTKLGFNKQKKIITLNLKIDTNFVPVMEYFEIFTERMVYCRKAAEYLGYKFGLVINNFKLL